MTDNKQLFSPRFREACFGRKNGLGKWLCDGMHSVLAGRLARLPSEPLTKVQFNQCFVVSQEASVSDGFFRYYWRTQPDHPYHVRNIEGFDQEWFKNDNQVIYSLDHVAWGLYRLYVDGLLFFGNTLAAFSSLRSLEEVRHQCDRRQRSGTSA